MVEYGGIVREGGGAGGGRGGPGFDVGGNVMDFFSDLVERIAALPPEVLLVAVAAVLIGGLVISLRTS